MAGRALGVLAEEGMGLTGEQEILVEEILRAVGDREEFGFHRGVDNLRGASYLLPIIEKRTFEEIKSKILEYRQKKTGG